MPSRPLSLTRAVGPDRRVSMLGTYPPRLCGLATFAAALEDELTKAGDDVTVVAINDGRNDNAGAISVRREFELFNGLAGSVRDAADVLSRADVAIVQHEYGIYGGVDGDEVVDVLRAVLVPAIVVLHTVPSAPTQHQRRVLEEVCDLAARVVVMTAAAGQRLADGYSVDVSKVAMIPHGAVLIEGLADGAATVVDGGRLRLLTWGLIGPGKGIEHAIRAMALVKDLRSRLHYTVAGATHPNVFARDGDRYRQSLIRDAWASGVASSVRFDDTYRDVAALGRIVAGASLVVLPYDSHDQVTSGVLVDAIAAGRPVIATAFPHAVELLSDGAGIVVPHMNPVAIASAIRQVATDPERLDAMAARAREIAPSLQWSAVAAQYRRLCDDLLPVAGAVAV